MGLCSSATMRAFSSKGEYAFVSVGGTATGIIAIGGVATGIVAIGGALSIGVISIGMNAVGSVVALGMNTAAPISISLINGVGIFTLAGVNGWGAWTWAGVNATGAAGRGGVNSGRSILPALVVIVALVVASFVVRGARRDRNRHRFATTKWKDFLRSHDREEQRVRARLVAIEGDSIELGEGDDSRKIEGVHERVLASARAVLKDEGDGHDVIVRLAREQETIADEDPSNYRERPHVQQRLSIRCLDLERDAPSESILPQDAEEIQWVLSWSARISAVAGVVAVIYLLR